MGYGGGIFVLLSLQTIQPQPMQTYFDPISREKHPKLPIYHRSRNDANIS